MPFHDWQFWVVTAITIAALFKLKRVLVPKKKGKKTTLTVGGQPVSKKHKPRDKGCGCS